MTDDLQTSIHNLNNIQNEITEMSEVLKRAYQGSNMSDDLFVLLRSTYHYFLIRVNAFRDEYDEYFVKGKWSEGENSLKNEVIKKNLSTFKLLDKYWIKEYRNAFLAHNNRVRTKKGKYLYAYDTELSNASVLPDFIDEISLVAQYIKSIRDVIFYTYKLE